MASGTVSQRKTISQQGVRNSIQIGKWLRHIVIGTLLLFVTLGATTYVAGQWARSNLARQVQPPGRLIKVGGYQIHLNCTGEGSSTVIMEAGLNDFSLHWALVQPEVAKFARVCTYDRAGLGWSEPTPHPRTKEVVVDELHTVLTNAEIKGPYVLVGHSFGGILMRAFAQQHPSDVEGLILVDSAHENQLAQIPRMHKAFEQLIQQFGLLSKLASVGLIALSPGQIPNQGLPDTDLADYRALLATTDYFDAAATESQAFYDSLRATTNLPLAPLGDLPLIVISRGEEETTPGLTPTEIAQNEESWHVMQAELAALSSQSQHISAEQSGHYIQLQQPALVIGAIWQVVQTTQAESNQ